MNTALTNIADNPSPQRTFETQLTSLWLRPGVFAISGDGTRYVNEHVQWLWEQFQRDIR